MSNVLIGIIGVILFIGLALAGALILGDDFKSASTSSRAAAVVTQLQQVQSAVEMWRLKTGQRVVVGQTTAFLVPRFLKTPGMNVSGFSDPTIPQWNQIWFNNDVDPNGYLEPTLAAGWAEMIIGPSYDTKAQAMCQAIEEGQGRTGALRNDRGPKDPIGCVIPNGQYYTAYATIGF